MEKKKIISSTSLFPIFRLPKTPIGIVFLNRNSNNSTTIYFHYCAHILSLSFHYYRRLFCPFLFKQEKEKQPFKDFSTNLRIIHFNLSSILKMFGGGSNGNTMFPVSEEENRVGYDSNSLPQFKLFGHVPIDSGVDVTNTMYNELALAANRPIKRVREADPVCRQKGIQISMNNNFRSNDVGHIGTLLNPNPVSTGLRLSCQEERNSSVFSADENMRNTLPGNLSLGNSVKLELDRQRAEFDHYMNRQEENLQKGVRELNQRQIVCILNALGGVKTKLQEKQNEIENINRKNKELGDRIKQVVYEAQSWRHRAKYNESVANLLKSNIQQLMAQGTARAQEGSGESEVDDAVSSMNHHGIVSGSGKQVPLDHQLNCRACKGKEVSVLLFPCRHFCLCIDCEGLINICPICQVMKTASLQVYMS